jgi:lipoprotein-anchoring transpeptidase ErfK/SrfK
LRSDQGMAVDPHALRVKRVLKIDGPFRHGDFAWDEKGAPATGRIIVTVDLRAQTLSVFREGYEIGAAVILYGATDKPSPKGAFPITQKIADYYSRTYNNAPMPYAQRLTSDGVFIHGSDVKWGNATHGCIGVPKAFAEKLFGVTKVGDLVVITDGKMLDVSKATVG